MQTYLNTRDAEWNRIGDQLRKDIEQLMKNLQENQQWQTESSTHKVVVFYHFAT
jgi:hypothetical protein